MNDKKGVEREREKKKAKVRLKGVKNMRQKTLERDGKGGRKRERDRG